MRRLWAAALLLVCLPVVAADYAADWGPAVGSTVVLDANDQDGVARNVANLSGDRGVLLLLSRSADW